MKRPILLVLALLAAGCSAPVDEPTDGTTTTTTRPTTFVPTTPADPEGKTAYGVGLSPRSFSGSEFAAFFDEAKDVGSIILWGGPPEDLADPSGAPTVVSSLARQKGMGIAIQTSYISEAGEKPFDEVAQAKWRQEVVAFAALHQPEFLALGVELNRFWEGHEAFFVAYSKWFNATYDAIKAQSPRTRVFVTYQYEQMTGNAGGLYGGNASGADEWHLLALFEKSDLVGFTTYPGYVVQDAAEVPDDHYDAIRAHTSKPIAFSEVAHYVTLEKAPGWESSPEEQAAFATWFLGEARALDAELVVWLHLHDQAGIEPPMVRSMGLIDQNGAKRPAYEAWVNGQAS